MKIVKFNNGKYALQKGSMFNRYYLSTCGGYWFCADDNVAKCCLFNSTEDILKISGDILAVSNGPVEEIDLKDLKLIPRQ